MTKPNYKRGVKRQALSRAEYMDMLMDECHDLADRESVSIPEAVDILRAEGYLVDEDPTFVKWLEQWPRD